MEGQQADITSITRCLSYIFLKDAVFSLSLSLTIIPRLNLLALTVSVSSYFCFSVSSFCFHWFHFQKLPSVVEECNSIISERQSICFLKSNVVHFGRRRHRTVRKEPRCMLSKTQRKSTYNVMLLRTQEYFQGFLWQQQKLSWVYI